MTWMMFAAFFAMLLGPFGFTALCCYVVDLRAREREEEFLAEIERLREDAGL